MATMSRSDEELLEVMTERLVDGFDGLRQLFRNFEPKGQECVTPEALLKVMYNTIGHVSTEKFHRMLKNLGLDNKETISFDVFVSRFKEFGDIQQQWTPPLQLETEEARLKKAHPEEHLRDCDIHAWGELKVAPEATYLLKKALREKKIDFRSLLPDECFVPNGVVTKIQLRVALKEIGVNLTDGEYRKFWEHYDKKLVGHIPLERMYTLMNLDPQGNPTSESPKVRTPVKLKPNTGVPPRDPAKAAREFALGRHKIRGDPQALADGIRGEGIQTPASAGRGDSKSDLKAEEEMEKPESPAAEAAARSKIRAVMSSTPKALNKFDCIIDCLHHKFEERYTSMTMAFKLFDIHHNGNVMRIDFRRVLREYGFPVTALQLGPLINRLGLSIKHGLVSYQQVLSKLMNRTDPFTSTVLDDFITETRQGMSPEPTSEAEGVEGTARKVVQYLHQDYVKLSADILRKDSVDKGSVKPEEMRASIERCLGRSMTDRQWENLLGKLTKDDQGQIRYADFMVAFNKDEPGEWNMLKHGIVTVPRNKVVNQPTEEVQRLERSKTDVYPPPPVSREHRPVDQLRKELKAFFAENLHAVDHRFKELDRKSHKRFSKWQFGAILRLCGFPMTEKELNDVWLSLKLSDDNMSTFNAVVMEFAPNFTPFHGPSNDAEEEGEEEKTEKEEVRKERGGEVEAGVEPPLEAECTEPLRFNPEQYLTSIVMKAYPAVRMHWEKLRQSFRNQDPHGFGTVSFKTLQRIVDGLGCGLTRDERDQLCAQYDFRRIGRCNYLAFMKTFSEPPPAEPRLVYAAHRHKMTKQPPDALKPITISEALHRIRNKLIKNWKNLRRAFQKHDKSRTGQMTVANFKRVLAECSIPLTEDDLYHILSEFDANMDGRISYQEFLDALLRMDALALEG